MQQFMVEVSLPAKLTQEIIELIPSQRNFIDDLLQRGVILSYTLTLDRAMLWVVFEVENSKEVRTYLNAFPIADYVQFTIHELAFHNAADSVVPAISLN
jgi:muconolactone delta-isomerase